VPVAASRRAIASPIPLDPPVTIARCHMLRTASLLGRSARR
jgi:hypothetical protein